MPSSRVRNEPYCGEEDLRSLSDWGNGEGTGHPRRRLGQMTRHSADRHVELFLMLVALKYGKSRYSMIFRILGLKDEDKGPARTFRCKKSCPTGAFSNFDMSTDFRQVTYFKYEVHVSKGFLIAPSFSSAM